MVVLNHYGCDILLATDALWRSRRSKVIMHKKKVVFFSGTVKVVFHKGPLGDLLQEPTEEARLIKNNPCLQDKSAPVKEELVRQNALTVVRQKEAAPTSSSEDDQLVGFGTRAKSTWRESWNSWADGYASFITGAACVPGTQTYKMQQYLWNRQQSARLPVLASSATSEPKEMDEDDELESAMLNISPSKLREQSPPSPPSSS
ncbi:hypothetical protein PHYPO_G00100990 [Pangasianodon hypophthalmus]|uniref:Uncharacterized protein n=1 Tax=Pangasianodon hypophthalmus TaxID=310915 RepID=A0A5N5PYJ8_PANHP|nr:hypothetical protein PHYPO_G00100990 [Pangasianodon hypophthalmus]